MGINIDFEQNILHVDANGTIYGLCAIPGLVINIWNTAAQYVDTAYQWGFGAQADGTFVIQYGSAPSAQYLIVNPQNNIVLSSDGNMATKWNINDEANGYTIQDQNTGQYLSFESTNQPYTLSLSPAPFIWNCNPAIFNTDLYITSAAADLNLTPAEIAGDNVTLNTPNPSGNQIIQITNPLYYSQVSLAQGAQMQGNDLYFVGVPESIPTCQTLPGNQSNNYWTIIFEDAFTIKILCTYAQGNVGWLVLNDEDPNNIVPFLSLAQAASDPPEEKQKWKFTKAGKYGNG